MRIAHIFSSNFLAGSVMYALQLAEKQTEQGHEVFIITDVKVSDTITNIELPISDRKYPSRFRNIKFINKFIKDKDIHVIHAHSRAASWVSFFASLNTNTALVSTIHGIQGKKSIINNKVYGEKVIAICENVLIQLKDQIQIEKKKLVLIPNGIQFGNPPKQPAENKNEKVISLIGRLNGPKGEIAESFIGEVFPKLLIQHPTLFINILGGEWEAFPDSGKAKLEELKKQYPTRVKFVGFTKEIKSYMQSSSLIIGAGRVALEGIELNVPVYAVGESNSIGILTSQNINDAMASNFGDILPEKRKFNIDASLVYDEINNFLANTNSTHENLSSFIQQYDVKNVVEKVYEVYKAALIQKIHPKHIPILMYHKVPDKPIDTQHKIFVTKNNFKKHLQFFHLRGLKTITLKQYNDISEGKISAKQFPSKPFIITFDDGYLDNYSNMLPLTDKYNFKGILFLLGNFNLTHNNWDKNEDPNANKLMSTEQKMSFVKSGWEIGAHTLTHPHLTQISINLAKEEIDRSKKQIEETLNVSVITFAYPYGDYNDETKKLAGNSGFEFAVATDTGGMLIDDDRFAIFRVNMFPNESIFSLYKKTSNWYRTYYFKKRGK